MATMLMGCPASSLAARRRRAAPLPEYVTPRLVSAWRSHGRQGSLRTRRINSFTTLVCVSSSLLLACACGPGAGATAAVDDGQTQACWTRGVPCHLSRWVGNHRMPTSTNGPNTSKANNGRALAPALVSMALAGQEAPMAHGRGRQRRRHFRRGCLSAPRGATTNLFYQ
jgi:hypothetical protein